MNKKLFIFILVLFVLVLISCNIVGASFDLKNGKSFNLIDNNGESSSLSGKFSVNSLGKVVSFSKGNLIAVYVADSEVFKWGFANDQWYYSGNASGNARIDNKKDGAVIDLFGWSTASTRFGISNSKNNNDYGGAFVDWTSIFGSSWTSLSKFEWDYVLKKRLDANLKVGFATIQVDDNKSVKGLVLLPDNWILPAGCTFSNGYNKGYSTNIYSLSKWYKMEDAGAVFFPASGVRSASFVSGIGDIGSYWTSSDYSDSSACFVSFSDKEGVGVYSSERFYGYSVRPVTIVQDSENVEFAIYYYLNNGSLPEGKINPTSYSIDSGSFTLVNPIKEGYVFLGWSGSNNSVPELTVTIDTSTAREDKVFIANWKPVV